MSNAQTLQTCWQCGARFVGGDCVPERPLCPRCDRHARDVGMRVQGYRTVLPESEPQPRRCACGAEAIRGTEFCYRHHPDTIRMLQGPDVPAAAPGFGQERQRMLEQRDLRNEIIRLQGELVRVGVALRQWRRSEVAHGANVLDIRHAKGMDTERCAARALQGARAFADRFLKRFPKVFGPGPGVPTVGASRPDIPTDLPAGSAQVYIPPDDSPAARDGIFVRHIRAHLNPGEPVVCKICGKSVEDIYAEFIRESPGAAESEGAAP